jgi:hypothetical protein
LVVRDVVCLHKGGVRCLFVVRLLVMTLAIFFWVTYLIVFLYSAWVSRPNWAAGAPSLAIMLLIGVLGWGQFGGPVRG